MDARGVPPPGFRPVVVPALRVSSAFERSVAPPSRGRVVSVHPRAINMRLGSVLASVVSASVGDVPQGVVVPDASSVFRSGLAPGAPVRVDANALTFGGGITVSLAAERWDPGIRQLPSPPARARLAEARLAVDRAIATRPARRGPLDAALDEGVAFLAEALRSGDTGGGEEAGRRLVGLGPGLTPAGDDVLVGLSSVLTALGDARARPLSIAWATHSTGRTTDLAAAFHAHAARGEYSARLHRLCQALLVRPLEMLPAALAAAASWGGTSGWDSITGAGVGLDAAIRADAQPSMTRRAVIVAAA